MQIHQREAAGVTVLELSPAHTGDFSTELFRPQLENVIAEGGDEILLDISRMPWINSTQLGLLIFAHRMVEDKKGRIAMVGANDRIRDLMKVVGVIDSWHLYETEEAALDFLTQGGKA
jgi:anti-anti-sigma factor